MAKPTQQSIMDNPEIAAIVNGYTGEDEGEIDAEVPVEQSLQAQAPIVDTGATPGSPVPSIMDNPEIAAIVNGYSGEEQQAPEPPNQTQELIRGGVEMFQKYNPLGLAKMAEAGGQMVNSIWQAPGEASKYITKDPAAVAGTVTGGAIQGAAELSDQVYNAGSAIMDNPQVMQGLKLANLLNPAGGALIDAAQGMQKLGDIHGAPKSIDLSGQYAANPLIKRKTEIDKKTGKEVPAMQNLYDASQMIGQLPANLIGMTPAGMGGKIAMNALMGGIQGTMSGVSNQMKRGQSPDWLKAYQDEGHTAMGLGGLIAPAMHLPVEGLKGIGRAVGDKFKKQPVPEAYGPPTPYMPNFQHLGTAEPKMKVTKGTGNQLPAVIPKGTKMEHIKRAPEAKVTYGTGNEVPAVIPKSTGVRREVPEHVRQSQAEHPSNAEPGIRQIGPDKRTVHHMKGPVQDVVDAEIVQHFGDKPDVHRAINERLKAIVEASDEDAGRMLDEAMREIKASKLEDATKALLRRKASQAYDANTGSFGYKEPKAKAEVKAKSEPVAKTPEPEPAPRPTAREIKENPEYHHRPGEKAGWRKVPKDGGGSQNVLELVDKNGNPIAGPNKGRTRITWKDLGHLDKVKVPEEAHSAFDAARSGKKQPTVAKAAEVKEGVPLKGKAEVEAQPEPVHKSVSEIRQDAIKKKQAAKEADPEHGEYIKKKNQLRADIGKRDEVILPKLREQKANGTMKDNGKLDADGKQLGDPLARAEKIQAEKRQALEDLTNEYMKEKNLSRAEVDKLTTAWEDEIAAQMEHTEAVKAVAKDAAESVGVKKLGGVRRSQSGSINLGAITSSGAKIGVGIGKAFAKLKLSPLGVKMNIGGFAAKYGARAATLFKNTKSEEGRRAICQAVRGYSALLSDMEIIKMFDPHGLHANMWAHIGRLDEMSRNAPDFYASIAKREAFASASDMTPTAIRNSKELAKVLSKDEIEWIANAKNEADQIAVSVQEAWQTEVDHNGKGTEYAKFLARYHESVTGGRDVRTGDKPTAVPHAAKGVLKFTGNVFYDACVKANPRIHLLHVLEALLNGQAELGFRNFWVGAVNAYKDPTVSKFVNSYGSKGRLQQARYGGEVGVFDKKIGKGLEWAAKKSKVVNLGIKIIEKTEGSFVETAKINVLRAGALEKIAPDMGYKSAAALIKDFESGKMPEHQRVMVSARMAEHLQNTSGYNPLFVVNRRGWGRISKEVGKSSEAFTTMREVQSAMTHKIWTEAIANPTVKNITPVLMYHTQLALLTGKGTIPLIGRAILLNSLGPGIYNEIEKHLEKCRIFGSSFHHMSPDGVPIAGFAFDTLSGIKDQIYQVIQGGPDSILTAKGIKKGGGMALSALASGKGVPSPNQIANTITKFDDAAKGYAERAVIDDSLLDGEPKGKVGITGYHNGAALAELFLPGEINEVHHEVTEQLHRSRFLGYIKSKYGPEAATDAETLLKVPSLGKDGQQLRNKEGKLVSGYKPDSIVNWSEGAKNAQAKYSTPEWREYEEKMKTWRLENKIDTDEQKHEGRHNAEEAAKE